MATSAYVTCYAAGAVVVPAGALLVRKGLFAIWKTATASFREFAYEVVSKTSLPNAAAAEISRVAFLNP